MSLLDPWTRTFVTSRCSDRRDPLHELEMTRALLAQAKLQKPLNVTLVRGLEQEVSWWGQRAARAMARERPR